MNIDELTEERALAILIMYTGRRRTVTRPLEVAEACKFLKNLYESVDAIARRAPVSKDMIREFLELNDLPEEVKTMIREGLIIGVDITYWISRLDSDSEKIKLAKIVLAKNLTSSDVRSIVDLKRRRPDTSILGCVEQVLASKPKKINIHEIVTLLKKDTLKKLGKKAKSLNLVLENLVSRILVDSTRIKNIESLKVHDNGVVVMELTEDNFRKLKNEREMLEIPSEHLIDKIIKNWFG